jgi:hypothetical protein
MFLSPAPLCLHIPDIRHLISDVSFTSRCDGRSITQYNNSSILQFFPHTHYLRYVTPSQFSFDILNAHRLLSNNFVVSTTVVLYAESHSISHLCPRRCGRRILRRRMTSAFTRDPYRSSPEVRPRTDSAKQVDAIS